MIKAILFDCFGVLYLPKSDYIYQQLIVNPTVHHDEIRDLIGQNEYGLLSDEELFRGIADYMGLDLSEVKQHLVRGFVRDQAVVDYAQQLRKTYKIVLLSNLGHDSMVHFFSSQDRERLFDAVVISGDVGMIKPHPEIYEYACQQLGVDVSEAVMIDDVEINCEGARQAGLRAIQYNSLDQLKTELDEMLEG